MTNKTAYDYVKAYRDKRVAAGDKQIHTWLMAPAAEALEALKDKTGLAKDELICKALLHYHDQQMK
ncbi:hypothetical protein PQA73_gp54 [Erwinia phage Pavtok]|uniref:Uncharacterized protein n=1 Tax=Erwinia phage Pavtok TaxID=2267655 RepID=A0A345BM11_9CAUD|nr:hypothetical protein PQA73_gp54 [Erwinia phage Pavtok]AXF51482.1 hypothetical protein PAVTOK_54 [Erwinia phage Pavtok]